MSFVSDLGHWRQAHLGRAEAFAAAVRGAVLNGQVPVGSAMPSERALSRELGVSRGTVVAGLTVLRKEGWVRTRHGSGSVVCLPAEVTRPTAPWSQRPRADGGLDLRAAVTSAPHEAYAAALRRAVERFIPTLCDAGLPDAGAPALRARIADRYTRDGLPTRPEQILVTAGATAALTLLADHRHDDRRSYAVESPTYPGALTALRRRGRRLAAMPVTADGWTSVLDTISSARPALLYLTPDFQNPTGALMSADLRTRIAVAADRHDVTVVVDETMRDLDLRTPPRPLPHLHGSRVVSIGSLSKVLWGGLRVGWIRARAGDIRELMLNPLHARLTPPPLEQLIAELLLDDLDRILEDRLNQLRSQRDHLVTLLNDWDGCTFSDPPGGLAVWLRVRDGGAMVAEAAQRLGLLIASGPEFAADRTCANHVRLPFTATIDTLTQAVSMLRAADQRRPSRGPAPLHDRPPTTGRRRLNRFPP